MYVDGFVLVVPTKKLKAYMKMAEAAAKIWMEYGALDYHEAAGDDMKTEFGLPFPKLAAAKKGETVVFSWIVYKNRRHRDAVNKKVLKDERIHDLCDKDNMPFNPDRMSYGGFEIKVSGKPVPEKKAPEKKSLKKALLKKSAKK